MTPQEPGAASNSPGIEDNGSAIKPRTAGHSETGVVNVGRIFFDDPADPQTLALQGPHFEAARRGDHDFRDVTLGAISSAMRKKIG